LTDAVLVAEDIIPGWHIYRAQKNSGQIDNDDIDIWPQSWLGVLTENDPLFTFPEPPKPEDSIKSEFAIMCNMISETTSFTLNEGYRFVSACVLAGYNPADDGNVMYWFMERVYNRLHETEQRIP